MRTDIDSQSEQGGGGCRGGRGGDRGQSGFRGRLTVVFWLADSDSVVLHCVWVPVHVLCMSTRASLPLGIPF